jgi:hypothetical protein
LVNKYGENFSNASITLQMAYVHIPKKDKWWSRQPKGSKCTKNKGRPLKIVME